MSSTSLPPTPSEPTSPTVTRAWWALLVLSFWRQARMRQMLGIALGLLVLTTTFCALRSAGNGWTMQRWSSPRGSGKTFRSWHEALSTTQQGLPLHRDPLGVHASLVLAADYSLRESGVFVFSNFIFGVFVGFLLPLWCLSFATEAIGGEREGGSMVWLLTRPIPPAWIYLAKFLALLPWSLGFALGGYYIVCLAAGQVGRLAFSLYWPAVILGALAFSALFMLFGALFRKPAVVAVLYAFFLETIFGNMPGQLKRVSLSFYTRCVMFEAGEKYNVQPELPQIYLPVDGLTATLVLLSVTLVLLGIGMAWFSRIEYIGNEG